MVEPTCLFTVMQAPFLQNSSLKQGPWGACDMTWLGSSSLNFFWNVISQASPVPASMAALSYQSMSTPSRLFWRTKLPSLTAQSVGSTLAVVGNSVAPKALIRILTPASLYFFLRVFWIWSLVDPKGLSPPKYLTGSAQMLTMSTAPEEYVQKAKATQLQMVLVAQPGTAIPAAIFQGGHHWLIRSMQTNLTGQLVFRAVMLSDWRSLRIMAEANDMRRMGPKRYFITINKSQVGFRMFFIIIHWINLSILIKVSHGFERDQS